MSYLKILYFFLVAVFIGGCSWGGAPFAPSGPTKVKPNSSPAITKATMRPYTINGKTYYPTVVNVGDKASGIASWYGPNFHGKKTSNGEIYNMHNMTAAHKTLPMNTIVKVTNLNNNKTAVVRINDRGPFVANRVIDLSKAAATQLGVIGPGTAPVAMEVIGFADDVTVASSKQPTTSASNGQIFRPQQGSGSQSGNIAQGSQSYVGGDFMVQIGAFKNQNGANSYKKEHESIMGYKSTVKSMIDDNGVMMYRVFLTGFRSEDEARDFARSGKFSGAFIVRN